MNKAVDFLEKNVQWIAIGLGAIWLLWVVWGYVINPPVTVSVGGQELRPGQVDRHVRERAAEPLAVKIRQSEGRVPGNQAPDIAQVLAPLNPQQSVGRLAEGTWITPTEERQIVAPRGPGRQPPRIAAGAPKVQRLPATPAPIIVETPRRGRSAVAIADQQPAAPPPPPVRGRPGAPAPAPAAPEIPTVDKDWVTVMYEISMTDLAKSFSDANIPQGQQLNLFRTAFLQVELVRREVLDNGEFGPEAIVRPIPIEGAPAFPPRNNRAAEHQYLQWATANPGAILQPRFHEVIKGDFWLPPGEVFDQQLQPQQQQLQRLDPSRAYTHEELMRFTPQERQTYHNLRQQFLKQNRPTGTPRQPRPTRGRGHEGMVPEEMYTLPDAERPFYAQRVPQRGYQRGYSPYGDLPPEELMGMDMMDGGMMDGGWMMPQQVVPGFNPADFPLPPGGEFDPRMLQDVVGWAHDDTVEPGKTYQYKVRYKIKNPLYGTINIGEEKAMADTFALISPDSAWSESVVIPELTRFFIAGGNPGGGSPNVRIDVFSFKDGILHSHNFQHSPGDVVGQLVNGIDFRTRFTVVDIPNDPRTNEAFVLLVDGSGKLKRRDLRADRDDPEYRRMRDQAAADRAAEAVAGANGALPVR